MANFKIEIPDEKLDFMIELFRHLNFIKFRILSPDSEPAKPSLSNTEQRAQTAYPKPLSKMDKLKDLRDTINRLQNGRTNTPTNASTTLFRFPHGTEVSAINISTYNHLISTIENYYRTSVTKLEFIANNESGGYAMDKFTVMVLLRDNTELKAGYCNKDLS